MSKPTTNDQRSELGDEMMQNFADACARCENIDGEIVALRFDVGNTIADLGHDPGLSDVTRVLDAVVIFLDKLEDDLPIILAGAEGMLSALYPDKVAKAKAPKA